MKPFKLLVSLLNILIFYLTLITSVVHSVHPSIARSRNNPYQHKEVLGPEGNYLLEWSVDWSSKTVTFNVSAECKGYVGLGLSKRGSIAGADFVIGGVDSAGKPYFSDMHGVLNETLQRDQRQDWKLINANKEGGRVYLSFSRSFETCDEEDLPLNEDLIYVIWAYGDTDEVSLFFPHHGSFPVYLLDPDRTTELANFFYRQIGPHSNTVLVQRWRAMTRRILPTRTDTQICQIIKGPTQAYKHHIVGGGPYLPHEAKRFVRQMILTRCTPPSNSNQTAFFDKYTTSDGEDCYFQEHPTLPREYCTEKVFVWSLGGKAFYLPEHVGIPIGEVPDEYYMLEVHYHNSANLDNLEIKAGLDLIYTPHLRRYDGGILTVNYGSNGIFTIPPRSAAFNIYAHCSPQCTQNMVDEDGINVFGVMLQMRGLGKGIRLRHFRSDLEMPWIQKDDNYDHSFQKFRMLSKEVTVLPGDQITLQCTYDSFSILNKTTFSGYSVDDEVCSAYLLVSQRVTTAGCSSQYPTDIQLNRLGVQNFTWDNASHKRVVSAASSKDLVGKPLQYTTDKNVRWSPNVRAALQREMLHGQMTASCPGASSLKTNSSKTPTLKSKPTLKASNLPKTLPSVVFPAISAEYKPTSECQRVTPNIFGYKNVLRNSFRGSTTSSEPLSTTTTTTVIPTNNYRPTSRGRFPRIKSQHEG